MTIIQCSDCGGAVSTKAEACPHCGRLLEPQPPLSSDGEVTPTYAGFWLRVVASLIDSLVTGVGAFVIGLVMGVFLLFLFPDLLANSDSDAIFGLVGFLGGLAYFGIMESSSKQATLGKMALGLKVTDLDGQRIGPVKAINRNLGKIISYVLLGIGFFMAGFTKKKQGLHDKMVATLVVRS